MGRDPQLIGFADRNGRGHVGSLHPNVIAPNLFTLSKAEMARPASNKRPDKPDQGAGEHEYDDQHPGQSQQMGAESQRRIRKDVLQAVGVAGDFSQELARAATIVKRERKSLQVTAARADLVLVLDEGRIVDHGSPAELLAKSRKYRQFWQAPARENRTRC